MKKAILSTMALAAISLTGYAAYPWAIGQVKDRNPVGYVRYVESKLAKDLGTMKTARFELGAEVEKLSAQNSSLSTKAQRAKALANDFRIAYQKMEDSAADATVVHGCRYSKPQIFSQVSLLIAEAEGYEESLAAIQATLGEGESRMEQFAVQIGKTESQIAMLATKRELIRVQELTVEGAELLASVDQLMIENSQAVAYSPVRISSEIQDDSQNIEAERRIAEYLAAEPDEVTTTVAAAPVVAAPAVAAPAEALIPVSYDAPAETVAAKYEPAKKFNGVQQGAPDYEEAPSFQQSVSQK